MSEEANECLALDGVSSQVKGWMEGKTRKRVAGPDSQVVDAFCLFQNWRAFSKAIILVVFLGVRKDGHEYVRLPNAQAQGIPSDQGRPGRGMLEALILESLSKPISPSLSRKRSIY